MSFGDASEDPSTGALRSRDLLLEELGAALSHDLGASLRAIRGFAGLLGEHPELRAGEAAQHLRRIVDAADRADALKQELARLARLGISRPAPSAVDLEALVEGLFRSRRSRLRASDVFETRGLVPVWSDPGLLEGILGELVDNAITYRAEGRALVLIAAGEVAGDGVRVVLRDTGRGFDPRLAAQAVRACQQLQPRGEYPGLGMGLAFVSHGLRLLGTTLEVESVPGAGTSMAFVLPRVTPAGAAEHVYRAPAGPRSP